MTNTMTYKGYSARIEYDDDDGIFTGRLATSYRSVIREINHHYDTHFDSIRYIDRK